ncbi:hypothetical protein QQ008_06510 [Fulvivirgaceae bacterium BMA10]|uniref:Uncharacterized protein n=1 Tax=Splendidivirga corallicola TaxID=3051826 RepID=A0ABT8KLV5_9BACT|nr:hypothetical protein [Fulvivirgaceae bacterium BMA10]
MTLKELEDNIELGRQIFEAVPEKARPGWGTTLLQTFENYLSEIPVYVRELYDITEDENKWGQAHKQFSKIRTFSLENPDYRPESYIILAEKVAKVTYNGSGLPAPFDHDSGWFIPLLAKRTADHIDNNNLRNEILRILKVNLK